MPGAWEYARPAVMLAVLTREIVSTKWAYGFRALRLPSGSIVPSPITGMPFAEARNTACQNALASGCQWLFFLDDDVLAPPETVERLIAHGADIVSGLYYRRAAPIVPVALKAAGGKAEWVTTWNPPGSTVEVDLVGAGCLLIHRRVLERMGGGWFKWEIGHDDPILPNVPADRQPNRYSEDFSFCRKAKMYGFSIYLDTAIVCQHIGLGESRGVVGPDGRLIAEFGPSHA